MDLDGDGAPTTAGAAGHAAVFGVTGGGTLSCAVAVGRRGYELRADLDFDTNGGGGPDAGGRLGGRQRMKSVTSSSSASPRPPSPRSPASPAPPSTAS